MNVRRLSRNGRCFSIDRLLCSGLTCLVFAVACFPGATAAEPMRNGARGPKSIVNNDYFLPASEGKLLQVYDTIEPNNMSQSEPLEAVVSIAVGTNKTIVYYDHWEDGYETDITNPTQSSTEVWGDNDDSNGIAQGFTSDPDGLPRGTVFGLENTVPYPRGSAILYDCRDRVYGTNSIVVTYSSWPTNGPGPMMAGAFEVLSLEELGTEYVCPIGENAPSDNDMFEYVGLFVQAIEDNTQVTIDRNGPAGGAGPVQ